MATVNKNFKIKSGLIVEGSSASVAGYDVLTKKSADQEYIINLIGGTATSNNTADTVVKRDANGDFSANVITADLVGNVTGDVTGNLTGDVVGNVTGNVSGNLTGDVTGNVTGDLYGNADTATALETPVLIAGQNFDGTQDVVITLEDLDGVTITTSEVNQLSGVTSNVQDQLDGLDTALSTHETTTSGIHGVTGNIVGTSDTQTLTNKTLGSNTSLGADLNAATYKISSLSDPTANQDAATKSYVDAAISGLIDSAPATLDTLNELAAAIGDNADFIGTVTSAIGEKVAKAGDSMTGDLDFGGTSKVTSLAAPTSDADAATKLYVDDAIASVSSNVTALTTDDVTEGSNEYFTVERAQDAVATAIANGNHANITITYDDANNTLSFEAENGVAESTTADLAEDPLATTSSGTMYFTDARAQAAVAGDIATAKSEAIATAASDATTKANAAQANAEAYADGLVADGDATATPTYLAIDVNSVAKQVATTQTVATASTVSGLTWAAADYTSAELVVKVTNGTDSDISKVLLTLDSSLNISMTEYAVVNTGVSALMSVTASIVGGDTVSVDVTTSDNGSDVTVVGTLLI